MAKHLLLPFITLILFFSTYSSSTAQSNTIGLSGGIAFIDGDVQPRYDQGYSIGIDFSYNLGRYLSFESGYYI